MGQLKMNSSTYVQVLKHLGDILLEMTLKNHLKTAVEPIFKMLCRILLIRFLKEFYPTLRRVRGVGKGKWYISFQSGLIKSIIPIIP